MEALRQIAGWCCNNRLPRMRVLVVLHSSSSFAAFELVARWKGSGELGLRGETGVPGGVDAGSVLSFWKVCGDTSEEGRVWKVCEFVDENMYVVDSLLREKQFVSGNSSALHDAQEILRSLFINILLQSNVSVTNRF